MKWSKIKYWLEQIFWTVLAIAAIIVIVITARACFGKMEENDRAAKLRTNFAEQYIVKDWAYLGGHGFCSITVEEVRFCYYNHWRWAVNLDCKVFDKVKQKWVEKKASDGTR